MSITWLHLDYSYLCNKKEIYLLEWRGWGGGGHKASLSRLFPWGSGLISRTHVPGTQTLRRVSTWKEGRKRCKEQAMWLCPVLKMSPYLLQSYQTSQKAKHGWVCVCACICVCVRVHMCVCACVCIHREKQDEVCAMRMFWKRSEMPKALTSHSG